MQKTLNIIFFFIDGESLFILFFFYGGAVVIGYYYLYRYFYTILISIDLLELETSPDFKLNLRHFHFLPMTHNCRGAF